MTALHNRAALNKFKNFSLKNHGTVMFLDWSEKIFKDLSDRLPHWHQPGKLQYVTFRLGDSLPQDKIHELKAIRENFLLSNPKPWNEETTSKFHKLVGPVENRLLDNGYGSCMLKYPEVRKCLSDALFFGDGTRYELLCHVIMPNHVHLVMADITGEDIKTIMHSIKNFSARQMNKCLGRVGNVWMEHNFDRLVRSEAHLKYCVDYIIANPRHLSPGTYELYIKDGLYDGFLEEGFPDMRPYGERSF